MNSNVYTAHAYYKNCSDKYEKKIKTKFQLGQLVMGKVLSINEEKHIVDFSIKVCSFLHFIDGSSPRMSIPN